MAMDVSTLVVKVESKGIDTTSKSLDGLGKSAEAAEKYVQSLMDRMSKASAPVQAIISNMNNLRSAMNGAIPTNSITAATTEFKKMSEELRKITDGLGKGVGKGVTVNIKEIGDGSKEAVKGVESLNQSIAKGQNVFQAFGKELYHIRNLLGGTMLAAAMGNLAGEAIRMADSWTLMGAKLKMQLGSTVAAGMAQEQLFQTAQKLRVPMSDMITLYSRLIPAMSEYGYTTKDAMSITTAMGAALKVSGATGAEAASVMLQFSQAMQAGRLNGAEFNAIAEGAPIILRLIGKEINKTRGELKAMGAEGSLSVEVITEALKKNEAELVKMSKTVPDTVESAFVNLKNSLTKYIGELNNATGTTGLLAGAIKGLGDNISTVAGVLGYSLIAGITLYTTNLVAANIATVNAIALNTNLARTLGITATAATTAAGATGVLAGTLTFIANHPVIIALAAITTGIAYLYNSYKKTSESGKEFANQLAEIDKLSGSQAINAYNMLIDERLEKMNQENNKLTELIEKKKHANKITDIIPLNAAIERQQKAISELAEQYRIAALRKADFASGESVAKISAQVLEIQKENKWLEEQVFIGKKLSDVDKKIWETKQEIAKASEGAHKQNLKQVLQEFEYKKKLQDWLDNSGKKAKTSKSPEESFDKKYDKLTEKLKLFITTQEEELGLRRKLTAAESEALKISEFIENNRSKMTAGEAAALDSARKRILLLGEQKVSQDKINTALDEYYVRIVEIANEESTAMSTSFKIKEDSLQRQQVLMNDIQGTQRSGLSLAYDAMEADKRKIQSINDQITKVWELKAAKLEAEGFEALARGDDVAVERINKAIEAVYKRIAALKLEKDVIAENTAELEKQAELLYQISQLNMAEIGRTPGDILAEGFGTAGKAIGGMIESYDKFGEQSKRVNAELAGQLKHLEATGASPDKIAKAEDAAAEKRLQINAQMFGSMAKNAKGFFSEQSKGYKALEKAEKAFRTIELALAIKNNAQKLFMMGEELAMFIFNSTKALAVAIETSMSSATAAAPAAVANASQMPGPLAFVGAAAMIALLAGLGIAIAGGGGGSSPNIAAERQASAGTGSVLGDSSAKSESTVKALEAIKENSSISARYNEGMLSALKNIESALVGASKSVIKSGVQGKVGFAEGMGKTTSGTFNKMLDPTGVDPFASVILAPIKDIGNALFSVKKSVVDSGIVQMAQSLGSISDSGLNVSGYTTIETKKKKWGKTKTSTEENLTDLDSEITSQLSKVVLSMSDGIKSAAKVLGLNNQAFVDSLNSFVVDIGHISLQGLSPEKIQEQFTNIFSKMGDDMAKSALPQLEKFQNVGEGYLETLIRVTSEVATVDGIFKEIGQTFGVIGIEGVDAKMKLIELAGGLQELSSLVGEFYENFYSEAERNAITVQNLKEQFAALNVPMIDLSKESARIDFRNLVNGYKETNTEVYLALLKLAPAFASVTTEIEKAVTKINKSVELNDKILELTGRGSEVVARKRLEEIATLDDNSAALQRRVWDLEDEKTALLGLQSASKSALSVLEKSISTEKTALKKSLDVKIEAVNQAKAAETKRFEDEKKLIQDGVDARNAAIDLANKELDLKNKALEGTNTVLKSQIDSIKESRSALKGLFDDIGGGINTLLGSVDSMSSLSYALAKGQLDNALVSRSVGNIEAFKGVISTLSGVGSGSFGSSFDFTREKMVSAGKLQDLQSIIGGQIASQDATVIAIESSITANVAAIEASSQQAHVSAEAAIAIAEEQHKANIGILDSSLKVLNLQYESDVEYLDNILSVAKKQQEIADGTYIETKGVKDAVNGFAGALTAYIAFKDAETATLVGQINQMAFSTMPTLTAIAERTSTENAELKAELTALREESSAANRAIATNTLTTAKVLSQWDGDGQPELRNVQ